MKQVAAGDAIPTTMTCYIVCHAIDLASACCWPLDYEARALVVARNLDEVFMYTNHVAVDWTTLSNVIPFGAGPFRSTSVGDVVIRDQSQPFLCKGFGWAPLSGTCTVLPERWCSLVGGC